MWMEEFWRISENNHKEKDMRTAKLIKAGEIEIADVPLPQISDSKEVLVEVKAVGICGTDLHIFQGERQDVVFPRVMGHELSGRVKEVGAKVTRVKPGDRVVLDPVFACGSCRICKSGHENVCADVKCYGVQMDGGFQDYIVVNEEHLYPFDSNISYEQAALAEPFSIAANITERAAVKKNDSVVIIGGGTIGLAIVQVAKSLGAKVLVADIEDMKLKKAQEAGADRVVNSQRQSLQDEVDTFSPGGADVIIDAVGVAALTEQAVDLAAPLARVVVIGFDGRAAQIPPVKITKKELTLIGSRMNCHQFPKVMKWLKEGRLNADIMITGTYSLCDIQEAFEKNIGDGKEMVKTLILI